MEHTGNILGPSFVKTQVADLASLETFIQNMIKKIPRDGATVDLQPLLFQLTLDSSTDFLFGESVNILLSPEGSEQQLFAAAFDYARTQLGRRARLGAFLWTYRDAEFVLACKRVHNFVDGFVYKALEYRKGKDSGQTDETSSGKYVFLNELAEATDDPKRLRDELLNVLLAGRDTTAGLLSSIFHVLARRQDVWEKLQAEVALLDGKQPDYETLRNMKYLRNVLNETLRLWPIVPLNSRFAVRDTVLPVGGGPDGLSPIFVGAGQIVNWSLYSMHRRKDLWGADAGEFRPERWREKTAVRIGWGYLPFNGGPRICVGQQFALTEASYTVVRLLQEFKGIENRDRQPWIEAFAVTLASRHGTKVAMVPR
nr:cytochrome P450 [Pseudogymnoascus verrucosus]